MDETPALPVAPPEAVLLRRVRQASRISLDQAARAVDISKAWLSAIETGHDTRTRSGDGTRSVRGGDEIIAALAHYLHVSPERLETEGQRPEAAAVLGEMLLKDSQAPTAPAASSPEPNLLDFSIEEVDAVLNAYRPEFRRALAQRAAELEREQEAERAAGPETERESNGKTA